MISEMRLEIIEKKKIIKTVTVETKTHGTNIVESLQEFQQLVNAAITQTIEERGGTNQDNNEDTNEESGEDQDNDVFPVTPKKRKK